LRSLRVGLHNVATFIENARYEFSRGHAMQDRKGMTRRVFMQASGAAVGAAVGGTAAGPAQAATSAVPAFKPTVTTQVLLNGKSMSVVHEARVTLLDLLREQLRMTGTKKGCNEGACGACTVMVDGRRVNACMVLAAACDDLEITTVEGLAAQDGTLHAVQQAFIDQDAFQCGYCTPGQLVSAVACIREGHTRSSKEIAEWMSGNICRCAAYPQIVAAVEQAAGHKKHA
jgi:xanthine dehydrogenase YagT iron-sulfur-binding subunit